MNFTRALIIAVVVALFPLINRTPLAAVFLDAADDRGVAFVCEPEPELPVRISDGEVSLMLRGGGLIHLPGEPLEPVMYVTVAVPPGSKPTARLISRRPGQRFAGRLARYQPESSVDGRIAETSASGDGGTIGELEMRRLAGLSVVRVPVFPVQIDENAGQIELAARITVRVDFNAPPSTVNAGRGGLSRLARRIIINPDQAAGWGRTADADFAGGYWPLGYLYKFTVTREGIYRLTYDQLTARGVRFPVRAVPSDQIRLFGNGGLPLNPDPGATVWLGLKECPILMNDGGDGNFEPGDWFLFYGRGTGGWSGDSSGWNWVVNPFAGVNTYWLNIDPGGGGLRMNELTLAAVADTVIAAVRNRVHIEPENFIYGREEFVGTGTQWYGYTFDGPSRISYPFDLPAARRDLPMRIAFRVADANSSRPEITVSVNDREVTRFTPASHISPLGMVLDDMENFLRPGSNVVTFAQSRPSSRALFDWLDIAYYAPIDRPRAFEIAYNGAVELDLSALGTSSYLFDISDHNDVGAVNNQHPIIRTRGNRRFIAVNPSGFESVTSYFEEYFPPETDIADLWQESNRVDVIMVTADILWDALTPLGDHYRRREPALSAARVRLSELYNRFSGGVPDPAAIRNFLMFAVERWAKGPDFVVMCGDGDYNYRDIGRPKPNVFLPPYQEDDISSDDWFVDFTPWGSRRPGILPELTIGRLTAESSWQLSNMIEKITAYEERPEFGPWRNLITMVADDEYGERNSNESEHINGSEDISHNYLPPYLQKQRIYLTEYERSWGREKPRAADDLVAAINRGTLVVNYMGHGNPTLWAHEHVFVLSRDLARILPSPRQALFIAFTCDWAYWDNPSGQSFPEQLLAMPGGGAIGAIASTRLTYAFSNTTLARNYFREQFSDPPPTIGEALAIAKHQAQIWMGPTYYLLGDPTLYLATPRRRGAVTAMDPSELQPLSLARVESQVNGTIGADNGFNGKIELLLLDTDVLKTYYMGSPSQPGAPIYYRLNGPMVYRGAFSVTAGKAVCNFIVPQDVTMGGELGRMYGYFYDGVTDGILALDSVRFAETAAVRIDSIPPQIQVFFDHRGWRPGDPVPPNPTLIVELSDSSGLNLTGAMGHGVSLILNGGKPIDLTGQFSYYLDNYQSGSVESSIGPLEPGLHRVEIHAWDSFNNIAVADLEIEVVDGDGGLIVERVLNWPNPFRDQTTLTFIINRAADWDVRVFTVGGRMIREFRGRASAPGLVADAVWDGRDADGRTIANGVYLYKVTARDAKGNEAEGLGRIAYVR